MTEDVAVTALRVITGMQELWAVSNQGPSTSEGAVWSRHWGGSSRTPGSRRVLAMDSCAICPTCPGTRDACKHPMAARHSPEAKAVDVFATVRRQKYPIQALSDYDQEMNRYAIMLIE
jgi:Predicted metal-binding protein (DUF2284)